MAGQRSRKGHIPDVGLRGRRLEGLFREELNSLLDGEVGDPCLAGVSVSRVELSRDGSSARIWFVTSSRDERSLPAKTAAAFERAAGFLRGRLVDALPLKRIPELRFRHDPAATAKAPPFDEIL